ncbi:MAG TPA: FGGY-family carbohydrate kinase [Clostridia bacterium]|jgi:sugar (pentulose or hexulose) kinase|nr:FGGY-family carbohydrate kinase [Clostridia bacterium]
MEKLMLTFDCGTQSTRAMLYNDKGDLVAKVREPFEAYFSKYEGWAEQEPELYWEKFCSASKKLKEENEDKWENIAAVCVTTMRDVGICLDKDRKPLRPCIIWLDRRKAECPDKTPLFTSAVLKLLGMKRVYEENRKEARYNWIKENEPEIWALTDKYVMYSTYLNYMLTGNLVDSIASTIGHVPMNYKKRKWTDPKATMFVPFKLEQSKLYDIVPAGSVIGNITKEASLLTGIPEGLPLVAGGSDKGCETLGVGAIDEDVASISFGTTATIQISSKKYIESSPFVPAYPAVHKDRYNPEIMIFRGYWTLTWFVEEFVKRFYPDKICPVSEKKLDELVKEIEPGCEGLYVEPYWSPSIRRPEARGAMIGFNERHTTLHVYRAIIEGINFSLLAGKNKLEKKSGIPINRVMVSGGGAQSNLVCQITADIFGLPIQRVQTYETSGLGAAICGFVGIGHYPSYETAVRKMVHVSKEYLPNPEVHEKYKAIFDEVYMISYPRLKPIFKNIEKVRRKHFGAD